MISNNIFILIIILIIIGIAVYFSYTYYILPKQSNITNRDITVNKERFYDIGNISTPDPIRNNNRIKRNKKKVRFNNNVTYNTYVNKKDSSLEVSYPKATDTSASISTYFSSDIYPNNFDTNTEAAWDDSFGLPLMNKEDKNKFVEKIHRDNSNYQKSMSQFSKYQTDNSTLIKTDVTIDPFKVESNSKSSDNSTLRGKSIKDIYDQQVAGPKAKPKKIQSTTDSFIIYNNEDENNGGKIKGTDLYGYDGVSDDFKMAAFGNDF